MPQKKILITGSDDMSLKSWDFRLHTQSLKHIKTIKPSNAVKGKSLIDDFLHLGQFDSLLVANRNYGITIFKVDFTLDQLRELKGNHSVRVQQDKSHRS